MVGLDHKSETTRLTVKCEEMVVSDILSMVVRVGLLHDLLRGEIKKQFSDEILPYDCHESLSRLSLRGSTMFSFHLVQEHSDAADL